MGKGYHLVGSGKYVLPVLPELLGLAVLLMLPVVLDLLGLAALLLLLPVVLDLLGVP